MCTCHFEKCKRVINSCQSIYEMKGAYRYTLLCRKHVPRMDFATLMGVFNVKALIFRIDQRTIEGWHTEFTEEELHG